MSQLLLTQSLSAYSLSIRIKNKDGQHENYKYRSYTATTK